MRLNSKVAAAIAAAALMLCVSVATAIAATPAGQESVALLVGDDTGAGYSATYGGEVVLAPAVMSKIELPGEKFTFQVYAQDTTTDTVTGLRQWKWIAFQDFEDIQLEDTNTVPAFRYRVGMDDLTILTDGSAVSPITLLTTDTIGYTPFEAATYGYLIRAEYKTRDSSGTVNSTNPKSYSETEIVQVIKEDSTKVTFSKVGVAKHAGTHFHFQVSPNCGPGTVRVTVKKAGSATLTYNLTTDEDGFAQATLKLGTKHGSYKVYAKFLGNIFGAASPTASKSVVASR
jgi:hypothetical protein